MGSWPWIAFCVACIVCVCSLWIYFGCHIVGAIFDDEHYAEVAYPYGVTAIRSLAVVIVMAVWVSQM